MNRDAASSLFNLAEENKINKFLLTSKFEIGATHSKGFVFVINADAFKSCNWQRFDVWQDVWEKKANLILNCRLTAVKR